jgi:cytochrome c biogenesis factor
LLCAALVSLAFVVSLFRGSKRNPSIVNMQKCSSADVGILMSFLFTCFLVAFMQTNRCQLEQQLKQITKTGTCKSDISY